MSTPGRKTPTFDLMRRLYRQMPSNLQRRIYIVIAMMIGGAFLEVISLGAILPFLALVSTPDRAWAYLDKLGIHSILGFPREDIVYLAGIAFVLISITAAFARTGLAWYLNRFVFAVGRHFSHTLLTNTLHQAYRYHLTKNTSETISTIQEVRSIAISVLQPMMQVASSITVGIFIIVSLVLLDPMIAFTAFISLATVYLLISALLRRMIGTNAKIMETLRSRRIQVAQEALGGIRDVLLDSSQKVFIEQFSSLDRRISNAQAANNFAGTAPRYAVEATGMVLITVAALYFNSQPGGIIAALPVLAALALGAQRLLPLMQQGYTASVQVSTYAGLASNLLQILEAAPPREYSGPPPSEAMPLREGITFNNVRFRYQSDMDDVLNGLDIHIPKGSRVGIIGSTGSGKSTTVDLLMGLLEPSSGELLIDGVALNKADRRAWHMAIAHVPQAIYLTDASLAANIAFGCRPEEIDMVRVEEAARKAELADFIATLPQGYDTGVGERGVRLSGGQRQRVGIARALYKNPSVLVLDEGTSALDNATEAAVMKSIEALDRDLTIVMIAHRLSTIAGCDFAVRLDKGKSVERLEPRELDQLRVPMH